MKWKYEEYEVINEEDCKARGSQRFRARKRFVIQLAKDLGYSKSVIKKLHRCKNELSVCMTLSGARNDPGEWQKGVVQ